VNQAHEALGLIEIDGVPRAMRAQDAAQKRADVEILASAPVTPGKIILILAGRVANVEESLAAADAVAGAMRIDILFLPGVHPSVVSAVRGARELAAAEALVVCELTTVAATLASLDAALKATPVRVGRLHLASGFGGRGFYTLLGSLADLEAAARAVQEAAGERLRDLEIIAAPHEGLLAGAFTRPWPLDPAAD
jgi:microcompartment protein CcmL/EutN